MLNYFDKHLEMQPSTVWQNPADFALEVCAPRPDGRDPADIWDKNGVNSVEKEINEQLATDEEPPQFAGRYASSIPFQFSQLFMREVLKSWRDPQSLGLSCLKNLVIGVVVGFTFWQLPHDQLGVLERSSLLFFGRSLFCAECVCVCVVVL
jgi:ABC-2 type transporter